MERREFLRTVGLAAVASGAAYWAGRRSLLADGRYVQLGTSITSGTGTRRGDRTPAIVGERLGIRAINGGYPGSCAGKHKVPELDPTSLYSLADAISSGNRSFPKKTGEPIRDGATTRLLATDFRSVTLLGLEYGTNDFHYDRPIGADADTGPETFKGSLNHSIRTLLHAFPGLTIFLITPWWMPTFDKKDSDEHQNGVGHYLKDYVAAMLQVAELNHISCLDLFRTSGVGKHNCKDFTWDGVHPNDAGVVKRGEMISSFIATNFRTPAAQPG
jgi:lysophospholipase L1-like esterase